MSISAEPIDVKQAKSVALGFLKSNSLQTKASESGLTLVWSDAENLRFPFASIFTGL